MREGRLALQRRLVLRGPEVLRDRTARDQGRPPRLRAGRGHRRVRRRNRQLALAAPHGRLELPARVRRQGRQTGRLRQGQRALQAEALAQSGRRRRQAERPRLRRRIPRPDAAAPDLCRGEGNRRVGAPPLHPARRGTTGADRHAHEAESRAGHQAGRPRAGTEQRPHQLARRAGRHEQGRRPGEEAGARAGTRRLDLGQPGPPAEVRRGARRDAGHPVAGRGDARTQRRAQPAVVGIVLSCVGADAVPPVGSARQGRRRAGPGLPGARLAADPRGPGSAAAHDRSRRRPLVAPLGDRQGGRVACRPAA